MEKIKLDKGYEGVIPGTILMDDFYGEPTEEIRITKSDNPYECIFRVQANYYMTGEWIV